MNLKINKREIGIISITLVIGLLIGWLLFGENTKEIESLPSEGHEHNLHADNSKAETKTIWTCAMHPQIRMDKPGKCPICSMDLIPLNQMEQEEQELSMAQIQMTKSAIALANIQTTEVIRKSGTRSIHLLGKIKPDERNVAQLTARFGGRIEKLYINYTGQEVRKGEPLALIYSPELVTAQKELLEAKKYQQTNPEFFNAAKNKLKFWDLTPNQIESILKSESIRSNFEVLSPINGTVTMLHVALGDYVKTGSSLFKVVDLSKVWVMFEAYETDLPWVQTGDEVQFTIHSLPGKQFKGKVSFVDPVIDPHSRIAQVRVEVTNSDMQLKPEMFADGILESQLGKRENKLMIPKTSVLWTGKRAVVYVKVPNQKQPVFEYREITLGPEAGRYFVVQQGLEEGEEVVTNGVFKVDAAAQLAGKSSMMNPEGGAAATGHNHGAMQGMKTSPKQHPQNSQPASSDVSPKFKSQMDAAFKVYLELKDAFVAGNSELVREKAAALQQQLEKADMSLLKGDAHMLWMDQLKHMKTTLSKMGQLAEIQPQRLVFSQFIDSYLPVMEKLGSNQQNVYLQFCPMANENAGAYWLSDSKEIRNPYLDASMLNCGETKKNLGAGATKK